eukprot:TRINITY_DN9037_c0_g1_i1.p1 TRINITY_DN9037_c0_g1~~TRINITY_DN9037_c0_g1_i1.p1  ORF type:complete len:592 (-),score=120.05 TRINITY_DN9037_c0_g1_i1:57-1802(-)
MASMNVIQAMRQYIIKATQQVSGMKVLILDPDTMSIVSTVITQTELLQEEVYLFEKLYSDKRDIVAHLKAVLILRPTDEVISFLCKEIDLPKHCEYYLYFTNMVPMEALKKLANADRHGVIKEIQEFYIDYYAVNNDTWTLNIPNCLSAKADSWPSTLNRIVEGLAAQCLSLKMHPYVRYQKSSPLAQQVAQGLRNRINSQKETGIWVFNRPQPPLLVILDRNDDAVTPLLTAWTYQALVHHFVGIENNRINMANIPGVHEDLKIGVTLSPLQDSFYKDHMYSDFGVIGDAIQALSQQLQRQTNSKDKIQNIEDVKKFLTEFPELKKLSGSVSKHVALIGEIQRQTKMRQMFDCSELEQELSAEHDLEAHVAKMKGILTGEGRQDEITGQPLPFKPLLKEDAIRLVLLFTLRYESEAAGEIQQFTQILQQRYELTTAQQGLVQLIKAYAGVQARSPSVDLFDTNNTLKNLTNTFTKGLVPGSAPQNAFQRHKPLIEKLAQIISDNALSDVDFPFAGPVGNQRPVEVLFFIVGGATYEEAALVHKLNQPSNPTKTQYLLGGTSITSPYTFLRELEQLFLQGG